MRTDASHRSSALHFLQPNKAVSALCSLYDREHREIYRAALRGGSPLLDQLFELRRQALRERFGTAEARLALRRLDAEVAGLLAAHEDTILAPPLVEQDFVRVRDRATPVLKPPDMFAHRLPTRATATLLALVEPVQRATVEAIFARSRFAEGDRRFRTIEVRGKPCIAGEDGETFLHLAGIAHELGHCLFEDANGWHDARLLVESETCAHVVEDLLVREALERDPAAGPEPLCEWRAYQAKVDALNLHYFRLELQEIAGGAPVLGPRFEVRFHVFRESYVVNPGYQTVYAIASLLRFWLLAAERAQPAGDRFARILRSGWSSDAGLRFGHGEPA